jgi:hypothetical protein
MTNYTFLNHHIHVQVHLILKILRLEFQLYWLILHILIIIL